MRKIHAFYLLVCIMIANTVQAEDNVAKTYIFEEVTEKTCISWKATLHKHDNGYSLEKKYGNDFIEKIEYDQRFRTTHYEKIDTNSERKLKAVEQNHEIVVTLADKTTRLPLKDLAWIQMPIAHKDFILSADKKRKYAILSSNFAENENHEQTLKITHLIVKKDKIVKKKIAGKEYDAWKVIMTLPGFRGHFWKATYWYRASDGILLGFEEVRGGPGGPKIRCFLIREE